MKQHEVNFKL